MVAVVCWPALHGIPRNSLTLVSPSGDRTTWWTRGSSGSWQPHHVWSPTGRLPVKVRITTKLKGPKRQHPDTYSGTRGAPGAAAVVAAAAAAANAVAGTAAAGTRNVTAIATGTGTGTVSCSTCGTSVINGNRGHNQVGLPHVGARPTVTVWPFSVSSNSHVNVTTVEKGIPNSRSFLIFFGRCARDCSLRGYHSPATDNECYITCIIGGEVEGR